ncbi:deoxyribonuclease V [Aeoliella sp.]|uniref:deoxyribonuclease V n=1 Tax=Aeoliella sp. TaxID=2795800 RepID=UPI003CCB8B37
MKPKANHRWDLTPSEARELQEKLRPQLVLQPPRHAPRLVAGVDVSVTGPRWREATSKAAVVVFDYTTLEPLEVATASMPSPFPYVPGLLSFREIPVLLEAFEQLTHNVDLVMVDGHGYVHPRRLGIASHLGLVLDVSTIGCAKTHFIGQWDEPAETAGSYTEIIDPNTKPPEVIGGVLRTRDSVKPVFISPGHRMDLPTALDHALACSTGYRLPEPTRRAHQCAAGKTLEELHADWRRAAGG